MPALLAQYEFAPLEDVGPENAAGQGEVRNGSAGRGC